MMSAREAPPLQLLQMAQPDLRENKHPIFDSSDDEDLPDSHAGQNHQVFHP